MAKLGDFFPKIFRDKIADSVSAGAVVYTLVRFEDELERDKFVVIAHVQKEHDVALCFFINKDKHQTIVAAVPAINACQVVATPGTEKFLQQDSFVACHKIRPFRFSALVEEVRAQPDRLRGRLSRTTIEGVIAATKIAPTISADHKAQICASLTTALGQ